MKKILAVILAAFLAAGAASAQKGLFIDAALGSNYIVNNGQWGGWGPAAELGVGYMFNPAVGVRLGTELGIGRTTPAADSWFTQGRYIRMAVSADVVWDVINTFTKGGIYHVLPYARIQGTFGNKRGASAGSFGYGGGIRQTIYFEDHIYLLLDGNAVVNKEKKWTGLDGNFVMGQILVGIGYSF